MSFVRKIANFIKEECFELSSLTIVVPSDRSIGKIKQELSMVYKSPVFSPRIITIDKWMEPTGKTRVDSTRQLIYLYQVSKKIKRFNNLSFEEFLGWGSTLLNDFNEVDRYLLDADAVFKNLRSIKELEENWELDDDQLSSSQKKFKGFWDEIPRIYELFHHALSQKNKITPGNAYRQFATNIEQYVPKEASHRFLFAGFNALSVSELTAIKKLIHSKRAYILNDSDAFYTQNYIHEAGSFIRKNKAFLDVESSIEELNLISKKAIQVNVIECTQQIGQVKIAAKELDLLSKEDQNQTLVLLCDESLISSIAKNIPKKIEKTNISLGLPIKQTAIKSWIDILFQIQENKNKFNTDSVYFYDFQRFINHSITMSCLSLDELYLLGNIERDAIKKNRIFQSLKSLQKSELITQITTLLFEKWQENWEKAINNIRRLNAIIIANISTEKSFERTILTVFDESLIELQNIIIEGLPTMSQKSFKLFFDQHWSGKNISFKGDQSEGIQIMGLLETRLLDFKNIIALGMNEGKLPATNQINSFIPMDLRVALGLPTTRDKQGLFAHHFYRLLHHCEKLTATYCSNNEQLGPQEKSRYLLQLELELQGQNKNMSVQHQFYNVPIQDISATNSQVIQKSSLIYSRIENYFNKPISASSLNTYLRCSLDFYYKYITELGEEQSIEEDIESQQFGSLIHDTLEDLYAKHALFDEFGKEFLPKRGAVSVGDLEQMKVDYKEILFQHFMSYFDQESQLFLEGKNLISYTIAQDTIENMLNKEIEYLKQQTDPLYIIQVEAKKEITLDIDVGGKKKSIRFKGFIDRIDKIGDVYRVIDYKSGKVKSENVTFKLKDGGLIPSFASCKHAVQLALYCLFFKESFGRFPQEAMIYSLTDVSQLDHKLNFVGKNIAELCEFFEQFLEEVINEIFNQEIPMEHNTDALYCSYCK